MQVQINKKIILKNNTSSHTLRKNTVKSKKWECGTYLRLKLRRKTIFLHLLRPQTNLSAIVVYFRRFLAWMCVCTYCLYLCLYLFICLKVYVFVLMRLCVFACWICLFEYPYMYVLLLTSVSVYVYMCCVYTSTCVDMTYYPYVSASLTDILISAYHYSSP